MHAQMRFLAAEKEKKNDGDSRCGLCGNTKIDDNPSEESDSSQFLYIIFGYVGKITTIFFR